jgi:hypothetical protein
LYAISQSTPNRSAQLQSQGEGIAWETAIIALSITRHLTEHCSALPLGALRRLLDHNDTLLVLIDIIERRVWEYRDRKTKTLYAWENSKWNKVERKDEQKLTLPAAQAWLAVYNLLTDPVARENYGFDRTRAAAASRLQGPLTEVLIDQIPNLEYLRRFLTELSVTQVPEATAVKRVVIEQVPEMRRALLAEASAPVSFGDTEAVRGWGQRMATAALAGPLARGDGSRGRRDMEAMSAVYDLDLLEETLEPPKCAECGNAAVKRCSRCKIEWYCGRKCQVKAWKKHKKMCDVVAGAAVAAGGGGGGGGGKKNAKPSGSSGGNGNGAASKTSGGGQTSVGITEVTGTGGETFVTQPTEADTTPTDKGKEDEEEPAAEDDVVLELDLTRM